MLKMPDTVDPTGKSGSEKFFMVRFVCGVRQGCFCGEE